MQSLLFNTNIIVTAILHDTIEDTELTKEMIAEAFSHKVANDVECLTRIKKNHKISVVEMVKILYRQ
ncbi:HD domain protein [Rickettsia amblyommatis str. Darkwater]|uniref:Guanosine polyphosphate pyrophosphohydrolase/synthetase n=1 Tax=Rickettsia amblyommatis (strain GAT-30V) TaxID=1105111 RepID=H8K2I1_RICAG|nr:guanosine polyphosphate pyrophosphohydrolase/synthetase [Rickettsia amblyommatis str. GAT-30V]KJV90983.1 HD domain protein [Rickettsia amblyommatis str. Darkwater]